MLNKKNNKHTVSPSEFGGIFAVINDQKAAKHTFFGLHALQHRGQASAGFTVFDSCGKATTHKGLGLIDEIFKESDLRLLEGHSALGQVRASGEKDTSTIRAQPMAISRGGQAIALALNGRLTNGRRIIKALEDKGCIIQTNTDAEIILHLLVKELSKNEFSHWPDKIPIERARLLSRALANTLDGTKDGLKPIGAYSLVLMVDNVLLAARDPNGIRPLVLGRLASSGGYVVASESSAFELVGADYLQEIPPGQIVTIATGCGPEYYHLKEVVKPTPCIFELVYFARPDSCVFGRSVYLARKKMGALLAQECADLAPNLDFAMPFPDSGNYAGLGYCHGYRYNEENLPGSGVPLEMGMIRNHYIGRTFIQPTKEMREYSVRIKLNPVAEILKNQRIAILEDSVVRGTTGQSRAGILRRLGLKSLIMLVASPPVIKKCYYGVGRGELVAEGLRPQELNQRLADFMGFDELRFLSKESLISACGFKEDETCWACFGGPYPIEIDDETF